MKSPMRHLILALTLGLLFLFLLSLLFVWPAKALDITVTNTADSGAGSLRQAIANAVDGDTILFDGGLNGQTITLTSGQILITKNLTISGPGANLLAISGNNASRVFEITSTVTISGVTIKEGFNVNSGGIYNNGGTTTVTNSIVSSNSGAIGGGIRNDFGSVTLSNSTVSGNLGGAGGGIYNNGGSIILINSTVSGNSAVDGGGIWNSNGSITMTSSTVFSNSTTDEGGGILNFNGGSVTMTNSTVSGNTATTNGGGLLSGFGSSVTMTNSTIFGNSAAFGSGILNGGSITMTNSIVANSLSADDCIGAGTITSQGYNLDSDNTCNLTATGDITNTNPLLAPLADNGGNTMTHALFNGSPAIDHIPNGTNGCGTTITSDQRGAVRPQGTGCEIGAYEGSGVVQNNLYLPLILKN